MNYINMLDWIAGSTAILFFFLYYVKQITKTSTIRRVIIFTIICLFIYLFSKSEISLAIVWFSSITLFSIILLFLLPYSFSAIFISNVKIQTIASNFSISVIVVMRNEEKVIEHTVSRLLELKYNKNWIEIIVIDDNSSDNSLSSLSKFANKIRIVEITDNRGKADAINEIAKTLKSDLMCIFDADSLPESDFLLKSVPYFSNEKIVVVQGRNIQYNEDNTLMSKLTSFDNDITHYTLQKGRNKIGGMGTCEGRGSVIRRSTFLELNGFDISLPTEDYDYGFRCQILGYKVINDSNIKNYEQTVENVTDFYHQRNRWLSSTILVFFKNIKAVLASQEVTLLNKIDFFFPLVCALGAINVNLLGALSLLNYINHFNAFPINYISVFTSMSVCVMLPALLERRKTSDIIFLPLMSVYYWINSLIMAFFIERYYLLDEKVVVKKANHYNLFSQQLK